MLVARRDRSSLDEYRWPREDCGQISIFIEAAKSRSSASITCCCLIRPARQDDGLSSHIISREIGATMIKRLARC